MIENKKQLIVAEQQLRVLKNAYKCSKNTTIEMPKEIYKAMLAGIDSQIKEIKQEIRKFKAKQ